MISGETTRSFSVASASTVVGGVFAEGDEVPPRSVGQFELVAHVGRGSFGDVWKARDTALDRTVAIKMPRRGDLSQAEADQFLREARTAAQLKHPNIVAGKGTRFTSSAISSKGRR